MVSLFGRSEEEHERLRTTVKTLGVTSVPGLAAALAWRERKTERLLAHELSRPGTQLVYEPGRRLVRWRRPPPVPVEPPVAARPPAAPAAAVPPARPPVAPAPVLRGTALKTLCPHCRVALISTGSGKLAVCPECGRLSSERPPSSPGPAAPEPGADPPVATVRAPAETAVDRRSQELFAAYVTARPIPCPKCRTPLRHRGVAEYSCPSCGQSVRFPKGGEVPGSVPARVA